MSNLLENKFLRGLFKLDMATIDQYISIFGSLFSQTEPKLDKHFVEVGLIPQHYLLQWWLPISLVTHLLREILLIRYSFDWYRYSASHYHWKFAVKYGIVFYLKAKLLLLLPLWVIFFSP